jgi:hypothetical protein
MAILYSGKCIYLSENKFALRFNTVEFLYHNVYNYDKECRLPLGEEVFVVHYKEMVNGAAKAQMSINEFNQFFKDLGELREERLNKLLDGYIV